ncbi:hypothetical protein EON69_01205 [bacterium]|nr:MAG: hypothetical protein EON69_01205 [bacterium]
MIHLHVIVWSPGRKITAPAVQPLALAAGFGCNVKVTHAGDDVARFARYVTKYVTKSTDDRVDCPWEVLDLETGELREVPATYKTWSQSLGFGCRMKDHVEAIAAERRRRAESLRDNVLNAVHVLGATILEGSSWGAAAQPSVKLPGLSVIAPV